MIVVVCPHDTLATYSCSGTNNHSALHNGAVEDSAPPALAHPIIDMPWADLIIGAHISVVTSRIPHDQL